MSSGGSYTCQASRSWSGDAREARYVTASFSKSFLGEECQAVPAHLPGFYSFSAGMRREPWPGVSLLFVTTALEEPALSVHN